MRKKAVRSEPMFMKSDLMRSEKYKDYRDVLAVVLKPQIPYTQDDVEHAISTFLNKLEGK